MILLDPPNEVLLEDLILAYRKVKVDCYFESGHLTAVGFSKYEENLINNLESLKERLKQPNFITFETSYALIIKSIEGIKNEHISQNKVYFSDSKESWKHFTLKNIWFRIIGQLPVDFHIISSLWIDKVGSFLEENLSNNSYGCRLKRKAQDNGVFVDKSNFNHSRVDRMDVGHFRPYFYDYKSWQSRGLEEAEKELSKGKDVIVITSDIKTFYHSVDVQFLLSPNFLEFLKVSYSIEQRILTELLVRLIHNWSMELYADQSVPKYLKRNNHCGIPVGLAASKVIANLLLAYFDYKIEKDLGVIHYGRYVDDIFLVLPDTKQIKSPEEFWVFCANRIPEITIRGESVFFDITYGEKSIVEFGNGKDKLFLLEGSSGKSFLKTIKEALDENSSEWRMMPEPESDLEELTKQMTKASSNSEEPVNSLRKSDGVSIQRLKFAIKLRLFESAVELLPKAVWVKGLKEFFQIVVDFVLVPEKLDTYTKYHQRILKLAIRANMPEVANRFWDSIDESWKRLKEKAIEFDKIAESNLIDRAYDYNNELLKEAILMSLNPNQKHYE